VLEAASFAIDAIFLSYERLKSDAVGVTVDRIDQAAHQLEHGIFVSVWSIVDQCHMLRNLLKELSLTPGGIIANFIEEHGNVTLVRNRMDHIHNQLKNIAEKKVPSPPLFGVLSFCRVSEKDIERSIDGTFVMKRCLGITIAASSLTHTKHDFQLINLTGKSLEIPNGMFEFQAFENIIEISKLIKDLNKVVDHFETFVKPRIEERIRVAATEKGLDPEQVLNERLGRYKVEVVYAFDEMDGRDKPGHDGK
jgi:hypothetical protein